MNSQPVQVELLCGDRLLSVAPQELRPGDEVDVPVWMDIWFPPAGLRSPARALASFDRVIILRRNVEPGV